MLSACHLRMDVSLSLVGTADCCVCVCVCACDSVPSGIVCILNVLYVKRESRELKVKYNEVQYSDSSVV